MAVKTAEKLLKELHPKSPQSETRLLLLENYTLLATKTKQNVEKALERLMEMAASEVSFTFTLFINLPAECTCTPKCVP